MTLQEIAKVVREANGSYDDSLAILMCRLDETPGNASSTVGSSSSSMSNSLHDLEFDKTAELIRMTSQFSRQIKEINAVIGEGTQTDETIVQVLEKVKGDVQEAILQLLSMPSSEQPSHSENSSSRDALRISATHISASSSLRTSSGIEELPINVNLSFLNEKTPTPEPISPILTPASNLPYPSSMTSVQITPASAKAEIAPIASNTSDSSPSAQGISSATAASASEPTTKKELPLNASVHIEPHDGMDSDELENAEWGVVEYDDEDDYEDDFDFYTQEITAEDVEKLAYRIDRAERDFLSIMFQEEFDEMLAAELHRDVLAGRDPFAPSPARFPVQPKWQDPSTGYVAPGPSRPSENGYVHPSTGQFVPVQPLPSSSNSSKPCYRKFGEDGPKQKKQIPSGPKYYVLPTHTNQPRVHKPEEQVIVDEVIDQSLLADFVRAHPVILPATATTPAAAVSRRHRNRPNTTNDAMPVLIRDRTQGEGLSLAHTVRRLKQLYEARLAALAPGNKKKKNGKSRTPGANTSSDASSAAALPEPSSIDTSAAGQVAVEPQSGAPALFDITDYVTRMFESARYKEPHELIALQHDELRTLRQVYSTERLIVSESIPTVICVSLEDPSFEVTRSVSLKAKGEDVAQLSTSVSFRNPSFLQLVAALPPFYPDVAPSISVRSMTPNCPITSEDFARLEAHLKEAVKATLGSPSIANLVAEAESWLCEDPSIRKAILAEHHAARTVNQKAEQSRFEPQLFASLNKLFNFERDYTILDAHDVLNQRSKLLKRAVLLLINGRSVIYAPTPGGPDGDADAFPVIDPHTGDIDEEASLRGIGLTIGAVRVILQHYNWNLGKLSSAYLSAVTRGTYETFLSEAGVAPVADRFAMQHHLPRAVTEVMECPTCLDTLPFHAMFGLVCGHMLCKPCYAEYVEYQLSSGGGLSNLTCPSPGCKYTLDQASLAGLLSPTRWSSYVGMLVSQFVQASPALRWCPAGKGCERIVQDGALDSDGVSSVLAGEAAENLHSHLHPIPNATSADQTPLVIQCRCSYTFCNACKRIGGHFPASCTECNAWDKAHEADEPLRDHAADEALSAHFVRTHSRECPNCTAPISKNGGCVHMRCVSCNYEFCWVCSSTWRASHYACSENSIVWNTETNVRMRYRNFDSLLGRHRQESFPSINRLREQLINAIYREDKTTKQSMPGANAINNRHAELQKPISFEDVPAFIDAIELLFLADYIVTNACKAGFALAEQGITDLNERNTLMATLLRALEDIQFLCASFNVSPLRKEHLHFVSAGVGQLKASIKLIVDELSNVRLAHLGELARSKA